MREDILKKIDEIEAEMKRIGFWQNELLPKDLIDDCRNSKQAFGKGILSFEQWLQFIFIPAARQRVEDNNLPGDSQVGVVAMREFDGVEEADTLGKLLSEFDDLVINEKQIQEFCNSHEVLRSTRQQTLNFWSPEYPPITCLFEDLGNAVANNWDEFSEPEKHRLFAEVELFVNVSDEKLATAATTGFLEALESITTIAGNWESVYKYLGVNSKKHLDWSPGDA